MACANQSTTLDGFMFTFVSRSEMAGTTTYCYRVKGLGTSPSDLSNWVLEVCPDNPNKFINFINVSCTKKVGAGPVVPASCSKVTQPNPSGNQVNLIGVKFDEPVGKEVLDPEVLFCVTFDTVLFEGCVNVGFKAGQNVEQTSLPEEKFNGPTCVEDGHGNGGGTGGKCNLRDIPFCCYVTVLEGFEPAKDKYGKPIIDSAIVLNCTFLCEGKSSGDCTVTTPCGDVDCNIPIISTDLVGCVHVQNALKIVETDDNINIKCPSPQPNSTFVCCCQCVCIQETLTFRCPEAPPLNPDDVSISIKQNSLDAELVDSCSGKSAYKITGLLEVTVNDCLCEK